ncbi:hypothetical protein [Mycobacteroides franklinii]|uniref:hypothetical protein n=1 Tax=Mycobacteroides franklinii TaxID=948102 RepID=UPI000992B878|nr:hypothetical protein [Mycobacteroides franklinii]
MSRLSVFGDPIEALDDYPEEIEDVDGLLGAVPRHLAPAWEEWLERRPEVAERVPHMDDPLAFVVLECISDVLGDIPVAQVGDASVYGIAVRNGWLYLPPTTQDFVANPCTLPAHIHDTLSEPRQLLEVDVKELVERIPQEWQLPFRHWVLPSSSGGLQDAARELLSELVRDGTYSEIDIRRFISSPAALDALLAQWKGTDGFLHTASRDLIWEFAESELRTDPEKAALIEHFTVDGEVLRPLIAAAFSDHAAIQRWLGIERAT